MNRPQEPRRHARSAFAAAFLSLIFPGLGHAYLRAWNRAIGFAAPPFLLAALGLGIAVSSRLRDVAGLLQPQVLVAIFIVNAVILVYRVVAAVDAYRATVYLNRWDEGAGRLGPSRRSLTPLSVAGLLAVVLVMTGGHAAVARYDLQALDLVGGVFNPNGDNAAPDATESLSLESQDPGESPVSTLPPGASLAPAQPTLPAWNGTDRLNVLLIGSDRRPKEGSYNTDTLIVASIDPSSGQVAMFSLPRDTVGVPLPNIPARQVFGPTWNRKINSLFMQARARPDLFPGGSLSGYQTLKDTLGTLYGMQIQYFVEVDFAGFTKIVDAMGGVTVNVQSPVVDDHYPGDNGALRIYIPTGVQNMTGAEALIYARSRHGSSDFDRAARQQRVILSLRQQADFASLARPDVLDRLVQATKGAFKTDFPVDKLPQLVDLAQRVDTTNIRSFVFSAPIYATDLWPVSSDLRVNVTAIRQAVKAALAGGGTDQTERDALVAEGARIWVLDGTRSGSATGIAAYLEFQGLGASAPNQRVSGAVPSDTLIRVYNGAEARLPKTVAALESTFKVTAQLVADPAVSVDVIVTTGTHTPALTAPAVGQ